MSTHKNIVSNNIKYNFKHLQSSKIIINNEGRNKEDIIARIHYSTHVYSKELTKNTNELSFKDSNGRDREFCPIRFASSFDILNTISNLKNHVWISKDKNGVNNLITIHDAKSNTHYGVYFALKPSKREKIHVEIYIRTAYPTKNQGKNQKKNDLKYYIKKCYFEEIEIP